MSGKEELLSRALDRALDGLEAVVARALVGDEPAIVRLETLVRGSVEVLQAELPSVTLLLRVRGNTEVERAALKRRRAIDHAVADLVAEAERAGDIRSDVDPATAARLLFGSSTRSSSGTGPAGPCRATRRSPTPCAPWPSTGCGCGAARGLAARTARRVLAGCDRRDSPADRWVLA